MMTPMTAALPPLVTREALKAFAERLVEHFDPQNIVLFGSQARGDVRWDSDADILVVMPFEGKPRDTVEALLAAGAADFPLDLHLRQPEEIAPRYRWGDPYLREAMDHGELLHGELDRSTLERPEPPTPMRNPVVDEWIARAVLIAQGVPSRKCRDLLTLSGRLRDPIPGWQPDPETLNTLTQAALAYLDPGEGHPEPSQDMTWAIAEAGPLRDCLRHWFDSLESHSQEAAPREVA